PPLKGWLSFNLSFNLSFILLFSYSPPNLSILFGGFNLKTLSLHVISHSKGVFL
ncbi:hP0423 family protein, partial [Helicobacter pylori]